METAKALFEFLEHSARSDPDRTAVIEPGQGSITYGELNALANQLRDQLHHDGVCRGDRVGVYLHKSIDSVAAIFGILKVGAAYVPVDPGAPVSRNAYILGDCQVKAVVIEESFVNDLTSEWSAEGDICRLLILKSAGGGRYIKEMLDQAQASTEISPQDSVSPSLDDLAYILYTSGSTGKPKGVQITNNAVINFLNSMRREPGLTPQDRLLAVTTLSFDIAALELLLPLTVGACVIIASREACSDGLMLRRKLADSRATVMQATPATWTMLLNAGWRGDGKLKILCGGEAWTKELARNLLACGSSVWNMYGPTETTIWSAVNRITPEDDAVHIGLPIDNTQIHILDHYLQLVPIGIAGELCIGGDGLARGYLHKPDVTAEKFIPDPFSSTPGARLYKTGDLSRRLKNGQIEFIGRRDHQIKIRGHRIELGEIDSVLAQHTAVQDVVVLARPDARGDQSLVAYIVAAPGQMISKDELYIHLKHKLPAYMLPSAFVMLDAMPLTPNGKLDRKALPSPDASSLRSQDAYVPARDETEELIAGIWADSLGLSQVGIDDNFFELGGHSLLATQILSRIHESTSVELRLRDLFESPTVALLAEHIHQARSAGCGKALPPITQADRREDLPLSLAQQRLWFIEQLEPGNPNYNIAGAARLAGRLDVAALQSSLDYITRRHEALRTSFGQRSGRPVQVISGQCRVRLDQIDLSRLSEGERGREVVRVCEQEAATGFDIRSVPLWRVKLVKEAEQRHVLIINLHHMISDGRSVGLMIDQLGEAYEAYSGGREPELGQMDVQYGDYAVWQREQLSEDVMEEQLSYWEKQLEGVGASLGLWKTGARAEESSRAGVERVRLSEEESERLTRMSRREGVTTYMTLMAGLQMLLHRYSGEGRVVVGTPVDGRRKAETQNLIGMMVNTVAVAVDVSSEVTVRQMLRRVRDAVLGGEANQGVPFERVVERVRPERAIGEVPFVEVMMSMERVSEQEQEVGGLTVRREQIRSWGAKVGLNVVMEERGGRIEGRIEYRRGSMGEEEVRRMGRHLEEMLKGMSEGVERRVGELRMMSEEEEKEVVIRWNETRRERAREASVVEMIEEAAERRGSEAAIESEEEEVSYEEMNRRANQVGRYLMRMGVKEEELVGVCMERSVDMVIGMVGVMKAGGGYVPMDAEYPEERLRYMVEEAGLRLVVTQERHREKIEGSGAKVIAIDEEREEIGRESVENVERRERGGNMAYAIYTSGSTGKPKCAVNTHAALANRLLWMQDAYRLNEDDRVLQKTPFTFDVSVWEFFWPLITGARLVLARPGGQYDAAYLIDLINERQITTIHFVPSMLQAFLDQPGVESCASLKRVICSGESLSRDLQERFFERLGAGLHNLYGPTEAAIDVTYWACERGSSYATVPIGRPIDNLQMYILDPGLQPVPVGVVGELHIGGAGLGRGYVNRPDLTAEKFIPNPFSSDIGARLYKTGDRGRYFPDGNIEFLGRIDNQIKLRGYRIELGEIEAAISRYPSVREVAVTVREDAPGNKRLVAYIVAQREQAIAQEELLNHLRRELPEYMLPAALVMLDAMPLNANGKLDRRKLPAPSQERPALEQEYVAPRTPVEEAVAEILADALCVERVGLYDNFFTLGGHSLLIFQVVSRIRDEFNIEVPLQSFLKDPTVAGVAMTITQIRAEGEEPEMFEQLLETIEQMTPEQIETMIESGKLITSL